jgi:hypothetical protein
MQGTFVLKHYRQGKLIDQIVKSNAIVDIGLDYILDVMFVSLAAPAAWYIGLIDNAGFTTLANADTMASHGWTELTAYTEAGRQAWTPTDIGAQTILNGTPASFTMNATKTIKGIFINDDATKDDLSGNLWSTAIVNPTINVVNADVIKVQYQLKAKRG